MPAPVYLPTNSKVCRCLEYALKQISHANNRYFDGIVVDRAKDPRDLYQAGDFAEKQAIVTVHLVDQEKDPNAFGGGIKVRHQTFHLNCLVALTEVQDAQGLRPDDLMDMLTDDVVRTFAADPNMETAAAALVAADAGFGPKPSCYNLEVTSVAGGPKLGGLSRTFIIIGQYTFQGRATGN